MFLFIFYKCWTYPYVISLLCLNNHAQVTVIQTQLLFCFLKTAFCVNDCFIFDPHALTGAVSYKLGPSRTSHPSILCDPYYCFAHFWICRLRSCPTHRTELRLRTILVILGNRSISIQFNSIQIQRWLILICF